MTIAATRVKYAATVQDRMRGRWYVFSTAAVGAGRRARWIVPRSPAQTTRDAFQRLTISGELVLITTTADNTIAAHDLRTGELRWRVNPGQGSILTPIENDERDLFAVFTNGRLGIFDVATGRGRALLDAPTGVFYAAPAVTASELYIAGSHGFFALRRP